MTLPIERQENSYDHNKWDFKIFNECAQFHSPYLCLVPKYHEIHSSRQYGVRAPIVTE
jgi:hypothetical protein